MEKVPKDVPWYRRDASQMVMSGFLPFSAIYIELHYIFASVWGHQIYTLFGILILAFLLLLVVCSFITVRAAGKFAVVVVVVVPVIDMAALVAGVVGVRSTWRKCLLFSAAHVKTPRAGMAMSLTLMYIKPWSRALYMLGR